MLHDRAGLQEAAGTTEDTVVRYFDNLWEFQLVPRENLIEMFLKSGELNVYL